MRPDLFHIGGVAIPSFWAMAFLGFFVAFFIVRSEFRRRGYDGVYAYDFVLWAYVGGWVGARLFIIPTGWDYFLEDPILFLLSSSGWVWYGGVVGGAVAVAAWGLHHRLSLLMLADIAALPLASGLAIGRIGCQLSGDGDYGIPSDLPWAMSYPNGVVPTTDRVHPTPIYEFLANGLIFVVLWRQRVAVRCDGILATRYLVWAGLSRFAVEFVRRNPAWVLGLTTAQWISIGAILLGMALRRWVVRPPEEGALPSSESPPAGGMAAFEEPPSPASPVADG